VKTGGFYMNQLKKSIQKHALNREEIYQSLNIKKERSLFKKFLVPTTILATLLMAVIFGPLINAPTQENVNQVIGAIAYYQVEINPQFEIAVDEDGLVVDIQALNEDAKTFELQQYMNMEVEKVIEQLIAIATEKGFINATDDEEDFVTVSSVVIDEENEEDKICVDSIGDRIRARIEASGEVDPKTNVIYVKATIAEKMQAQEKEVPLGLYVIHGMIDSDGEMVPMSEYVKNENALEKMTQAGITITKRTQDQTNQPDVAKENQNQNTITGENSDPQDNSDDGQNQQAAEGENSDPQDNSNDNHNKEGTENSNRP
jgi:hypothetical protein